MQIYTRAVCLNLDKRFSEQERISQDFLQKLGVKVEFFICGDGNTLPANVYNHVDIIPPVRDSGYPAWRNRPNSYNAFLCFKRIIEEAKKDGVEKLLLLEDDVTLSDNARQVCAQAYLDLLNFDYGWNIFYLGINNTNARQTRITNNLLKVNSGGCFHGVCLHESVYDAILNLPMDGPIDQMVERHLHKEKACYACYPNIALVKPGFSYCEGYDVDYNEMLLKEVK